MNIVSALMEVYYNEENWHATKLDKVEAEKYFKKLIEKERIIFHTDKESLVGYVETWRINYEQLGRIICKAPFSAYTEDVETGNIAWLANTWIHKDFRRGSVYKILKFGYYEQNQDCEYFAGDARRKRTGLIKVFKRDEIFLKEDKHGWGKNDSKQNRTNTSYCNA